MTDTRNVALVANKCAMLIIDMQNYCSVPGKGLFKHLDPENLPPKDSHLFSRLEQKVVPNIKKMLDAFRKQRPKTEVIYTFVECLTKDGRDQSLDYKLSKFLVPKGSEDAKILEKLKPEDDEILIPKTSCSVFNSTNIEYVLRNLGVTQLVITGMLTNQCVESAVRDAADRGFLVSVVEDAVATHNTIDHDQSLKNMRGFSRIVSSKQVIDELNQWEQ